MQSRAVSQSTKRSVVVRLLALQEKLIMLLWSIDWKWICMQSGGVSQSTAFVECRQWVEAYWKWRWVTKSTMSLYVFFLSLSYFLDNDPSSSGKCHCTVKLIESCVNTKIFVAILCGNSREKQNTVEVACKLLFLIGRKAVGRRQYKEDRYEQHGWSSSAILHYFWYANLNTMLVSLRGKMV